MNAHPVHFLLEYTHIKLDILRIIRDFIVHCALDKISVNFVKIWNKLQGI